MSTRAALEIRYCGVLSVSRARGGGLQAQALEVVLQILLCCSLLALPALLLGFLRQFLFLGHGLPLQFRWPASAAKNFCVLGAGWD